MLVDCVVVSTPEHHPQTWGTQYSPAMSGELRVPLSSIPPLELSVPVAVNDDNFYLAPDVADAYASGARGLAERYYESVSRYTTSSFMRLKLNVHLSERGLAPHIYESRREALDWLTR